MRIAAAVTEDKTKIDDFFGRAPYCAIRDTQTGELAYAENPAATAEGGAGVRASQAVVDLGIEAICMTQCGKNAQDVLRAAGVKICRCMSSDVTESLDALAAGELEELVDAHGGFHWASGK